jgi:hypothetical protein
MNDTDTSDESINKPWDGWVFWVVMVILMVIILVLTMIIDNALIGEVPNALFYILIPLFNLIGSVVGGYIFVKVFRLALSLIDLMAVQLIAILVTQIYDSISNLIWYQVSEYPGWLYLVVALLLVATVVVYCLVRWTGTSVWSALLLFLFMFFVGLVATEFLTSVFLLALAGSP